MPVIEKYWEGVLRRMQAEVELLAGVIPHNGERGRENEMALVRVLENLVPRRYGIGSGILVDHRDSYSRQTDIVIYEQGNDPAIFAQTTQLLYPVDHVKACVEVKTTLTQEEVRDCAKKKRDLLSLQPVDGGQLPLFVLLAYNASSRPATVAEYFKELPSEDRPDLTCIIGQGLLGPTQNPRGCECTLGLTPLHERDGVGTRITGTYATPKAGDTAYSTVDRATYPVITLAERSFLAEPARALLLFCSRLLSELATQEKAGQPPVLRYLSAQAREVICLDTLETWEWA